MVDIVNELRQESEKIVAAEPVLESFEDALIGDLMLERCQLYWYSGKRIPEYFDSYNYPNNLDKWVEHARVMRTIGLMNNSIQKNLLKCGLDDISTPFIYRVDEQYTRLKNKSTKVVKRFFDFNDGKKGWCSRNYGETKADVNYHACRRVLVERGEFKED